MLTLNEANTLANRIAGVWESGEVEDLEALYHSNVEGNFNNTVFYFKDICNRMKKMNACCHKKKFSIEGAVTVIDNLMVFRCRQVWMLKSDNCLYEAVVFVIYRVVQGKVSHVWFMTDIDSEDYETVNANMEQHVSSFSVFNRHKNSFLQLVSDTLQFRDSMTAKLSSIETECLFYYFNGYSAKEVARVMGVSYRTVEGYLATIKEKFHCSSRGQLRQTIFPNADHSDR